MRRPAIRSVSSPRPVKEDRRHIAEESQFDQELATVLVSEHDVKQDEVGRSAATAESAVAESLALSTSYPSTSSS